MRPENVVLSEDGKSVVIIDQTRLPNHTEHLVLSTPEQFYEAIFDLKVRGAPAIGICAGMGLYVCANNFGETDEELFLSKLHNVSAYINSSRPTAVNLKHALDRLETAALSLRGKGVPAMLEKMRSECIAVQDEDIAMCRAISEYGLTLVKDGDGILTHCNAGPLATSLYGTGLGTLLLGKERGYTFHAYTDETRPLLQGARLTAYELDKAGIDVTLICDNMASIVMKQGKINACFVGCDRVAANGDTANKIGTSGVAVLANHYGVPFYVFCPTSTIDLNCKTGADIKIEERDPEEIKSKFYKEPMAPASVKAYNPAFDVTDAELITAIITEKGICRYPYEKSLGAVANGMGYESGFDVCGAVGKLIDVLRPFSPVHYDDTDTEDEKIAVVNKSGEELTIGIGIEFTMRFGDWHAHYPFTSAGVDELLSDMDDLLQNRLACVCVYRPCEGGYALGMSFSVVGSIESIEDIRRLYGSCYDTYLNGYRIRLGYWDPGCNKEFTVTK